MTSSCPYSADHQGFYCNQAPFYPLVQEVADLNAEWANTVLVRLPGHLSDDLGWEEQKMLAEAIASQGKAILWEIDLGLPSFTFKPEDTASFYSFSLALEEFTKTLWPLFQQQTLGVSLYRGAFSPSERFPRAYWEPGFLELCPDGEGDYALYCVQNFAEYMHRLVSFLPDAALPFAFIDVSAIPSAARTTQLFSRERFEHLHLALKGSQAPFPGLCWESGEPAQGWVGQVACESRVAPSCEVAVLLPKDEYFDPPLLQGLDTLILELKQKGGSFRIVCEEKLTEQWDGLDALIVFSGAVSPQGKRKLQGFLAAGGSVQPADLVKPS